MRWVAAKQENLVYFLQAQLGSYSGKFLRKVLSQNCCRVNGQVERFATRKIFKGDVVEFSSEWEKKEKKAEIETLFENENLKVVNKPSGLICSPRFFKQDEFLAHRLDKETTGILLLAKNKKALAQLFTLFKQRKIKKTYLALVDGRVKQERGKMESFFVKKGFYQGQSIWGSAPQGLLAITEWEKVFAKESYSLVRCFPKTGRTHQIRVHFSEMNHPILIDRQYAKRFQCLLSFQRVMLHASHLEFMFQNQKIQVEAPLPEDFKPLIF